LPRSASARPAMEVTPIGRHGRIATLWLDELVLEGVCASLGTARELAKVARICKPLKAATVDVGSRRLRATLRRLQAALPSPTVLCSSVIPTLCRWERLDASTILWFQANERALSLLPAKPGQAAGHVRTWTDQSGRNHVATTGADKVPPVYNPSAINGHGALDFSGASVMRTLPFTTPLPQPITIMVVARARGDTTIVDSLGTRSGRFELCHGYPSAAPNATGPPQVVITADGRGAESPSKLLRGATRGNGQWHVYTAIFDGAKSEMYVDGRCEGAGKSVGNGSLDGLSMGCDHSGVFHLKGSIAELRIFHAHVAPAERSQTEAALALRYGLSHASVSQRAKP